ncbi:MAG: Dyp-type peroxidase [Cyanobacteria bacterium J06635_10]
MALTEADLQNLPEDGIDAENPGKYETLLKDLQGNILKGHGREHSRHLFLQWKPDGVNQVKQWIKDFATKYVTSAKKQAEEAREYRDNQTPGEIFANIFFSRKGYEALLFDPFDVPKDQPFTMGMKNSRIQEMLKDPEVKDWEQGYQNDIHALILIAYHDENKLSQAVEQITQELRQVAEIVHREDGFVLRNEDNQVIEHFGFVDGVSQPLFLKRDIVKARTKDCDFSQWDSRASLDILLVKDYNGKTEDSYGSFLVYRKYEQNVPLWKEYVQELTKKLGKNPDDKDNLLYAGAIVMGRFPDGTPVTQSDIPTHADTPTNNFNYDADIKGMKCPFQAHTRKTNPRGDTARVESSQNDDVDFAIEKNHRIARRAISYGEKDIEKTKCTGSGLLFLCFQANIDNQFNFIQQRWANPDRFVKVGVGCDPLIGQPGCTQDSPVQHKWPKKWGEADTVDYPFQKSITMKGGEYFFAPSISFLQSLS